MSRRLSSGGALEALRQPQFRLYLVGQTISVMGSWTQATALSWLVYSLTGSSVMLGSVNFVILLPFVPLALLGGSLADRVDKRKLLLVTTGLAALQAFALGTLAVLEVLEIWHIFVLALLLGAVNSVETGARLAFVIEITGRASLSSAIGITASIWSLATVVGPAVAAVLLETVGAGGCFLLNGFTFLLAQVTLLKLRGRPPAGQRGEGGEAAALRAVLQLLLQRPELLGTLLLVGVSAAFSFSFVTLLPAYAVEVLGRGAGEYGWLTTLFGGGCAAGALLFARSRGVERGQLFVALRLLTPLVLIAFGLIGSYRAAGVTLVLAGMVLVTQNSVGEPLVQELAPEALRGRVMTVYGLVSIGAMRLGGILLGGLADWWGPQPAILAGSLTGLLACAVVALMFPELRSLR